MLLGEFLMLRLPRAAPLHVARLPGAAAKGALLYKKSTLEYSRLEEGKMISVVWSMVRRGYNACVRVCGCFEIHPI